MYKKGQFIISQLKLRTANFHVAVVRFLSVSIASDRAVWFSFPSSFFTAAFLENPFRTCACADMLIVLWVLRIELTHQELGLLCLVYCLGAFLWVQRQYYDRKFAAANCAQFCIAPPI